MTTDSTDLISIDQLADAADLRDKLHAKINRLQSKLGRVTAEALAYRYELERIANHIGVEPDGCVRSDAVTTIRMRQAARNGLQEGDTLADRASRA